MGGGGGGGGYEPYYRAYYHSPTPYRGEDQINQASASNNANSSRTINTRIIPNMVNIDYYRLINRLHLEATERINDQTSDYVEAYPEHILSKIITIEEAYQRINDYIRFFSTFDKDAFKKLLGEHRLWFEKTKTELCALKNRANYYKERIRIENNIKAAIKAKRTDYLSKTKAEATIPFELNLPADLTRDDDFKISYINELKDNLEPYRLYISLPPPQTGNV